MVRIGIVGTGGMARSHAEAFAKIEHCQVVAACDVDIARATAFAKQHTIKQVFTHIDAMLATGEIDAVSIVTPDPFHKSLALQAIAAGKHVLCEKPLAVNAADALEMQQAAEAAGIINMVNLSYRNAASLQYAKQLIDQGTLGTIRHIDANYLQSWLVSDLWGDWQTESSWLWRLSTQHGSKGVLGDVGVHILDFVSFPVGEIIKVNCQLKTFHKAENDRIGEYTLDANDSALIQAEFANGALASIHTTRWATGHINDLHLSIHGDKGALRIQLQLEQEWTQLEVCLDEDVRTGRWQPIQCPSTPNIYQRFVTSVLTGVNDQPDFACGAQLQRVLDACETADTQGRAVTL